jgi:hypothetical protein
MNITISEVRYVPNSPYVTIAWRVNGGLADGNIGTTSTTQDRLSARVTQAGAQWGDDECLAEVRADIAEREPGSTHTVTLAAQPPQYYPTPVIPDVPVPATPAAGAVAVASTAASAHAPAAPAKG